MKPEEQARKDIDKQLKKANWVIEEEPPRESDK